MSTTSTDNIMSSRNLRNNNNEIFENLPSSALSWRYLGMFIDNNCYYNKNRILWNNYNNNYVTVDACRKVLWAAYYDPEYQGEGIAEYSFYDRSTRKWDKSTCDPDTNGFYFPGSRCRRLDCHESGTTLELLGVFKETDGLEDFTEQLFKHQGYCLWDGDKNGNGDDWNNNGYGSSDYEFMQKQRENLVNKCSRLGIVDKKGNTLYYDIKPLAGGDMTYGIYTDSSCTVESKMTWSSLLSTDYASYENQYNDAFPSTETLDRWNDLLSDYKVCQPCKAYNRVQTDTPTGAEGEGGGDGEGGYDPWGYNCYDDAGYTNCNQCYKFQSQTDMERASTQDLELATKQGTILGIAVDGVSYGKWQSIARKSSTNNHSNVVSSFATVGRTVGRSFAMLFKIAGLLLLIVFCFKLLTSLAVRGLQKRRRRVDPGITMSTYDARSKKKKKLSSKNKRRDLEESMLGYEQRGRSPRQHSHQNESKYSAPPIHSKSRSKSKGRSQARAVELSF